MKEKKEEKKHSFLTPGRKLALLIVILAIVAVAAYFGYYYLRFKGYDKYKEYLSTYSYEEGKAYSPIEKNNAKLGMDLVAESKYLKLYADTTNGNVAVEDKRDGSITYSNPLNADEDTVANGSNKNYLKSQFMLYYYTSDVKSGMYDSFTECIERKQLSAENIENGVRFIYVVGNTVPKSAADPIYFEIPMEYRLMDDYLEVSIPTGAIKEYGGGAVYRIQLLRYMGASTYDEEGYLVVPNASGSLINFNNNKTSEAQYSQYIYDIDPMASGFIDTENVNSAKLNLYGICREDRSILATIEDGASTCVLTAGVSGLYNDYNYCYPTFVLRNIDNLKSFGNSSVDVYVLEDDIYDINCRMRYTFLNEGTGYSGIASYYRDRLIAEGVLGERRNSGDIPFYYDVLAGVKETSHFLGVQYSKDLAMTTFEEAGAISDELLEGGITNQVMNLEGWFNGGYYQKATRNVKVTSSLGNKKELEKLQDKVTNNGGRLFAEVAFQKVTFADKRYNYRAEGSRYFGAGYAAAFGMTNPTTYQNTSGMMFSEIRYNLLSPKFLPRYIGKFVSDIEKIDVEGLCLRDLGDVLVSDKRRTEIISREEALDVVLGQANILKGTGKSLMTQNANAYAFGFGTDILNVPVEENTYPITDASIPLYEMIIHGYIDYSSDVLNTEDSLHMNNTILKLIEAGASPHYVFTMQESSLMKDTATSNFFATTFSRHKDEAIDTYSKINEALSQVSGATMIEHEILDNGVRKCTYDNGKIVYVNYAKEDCMADGINVEKESWRIGGAE